MEEPLDILRPPKNSFKAGGKHNRNTKGAKELEALIRKMV